VYEQVQQKRGKIRKRRTNNGEHNMLVAYNRKCKYTLRMTKLHSGKVAAEDDFVEENEEPLADDPVLEE
jgi:hypothetical protein